MTDQSILADIAKNEKDDYARRQAVQKVTNQLILVNIACNLDECQRVRDAAIMNLNDQSVLADIAKNDDDNYLRQKAGDRLEKLQKNG